jgi:outer membrane immunogenic protein
MIHKNLVVALLGVAGAMFMVSIACATEQIAAIPEGFDWTGFYLGIGGGFGAVKHKMTTFGDVGLGGHGSFGELTLGYDHMLTDRLLLGGFIDTHVGNAGVDVGGGGTTLNLSDEYGIDAVARFGYVLNGSTLGYILGGYSWERFKTKAAVPPIAVSNRHGDGGYVVGAGMETAIGHNWTIKAEYRYASYDRYAAITGPGGSIYNQPSTHTFHIAANYRFGARDNAGSAIASPAYDWTGFYVGAALGTGEVMDDISSVIVDYNGIGGDGILGELDAGYDYDFGNFVAGVMVDGIYSGIGGGNASTSAKVDYGFDVLGRVGMKVNPSTLAYVLGGYSWAHFKLPGLGVDDWSGSGYSVGGGLETAISTHTTLGIEYRYAQYADEDFSVGAPIGTAKIEPSTNTMRVGLKYKFN